MLKEIDSVVILNKFAVYSAKYSTINIEIYKK